MPVLQYPTLTEFTTPPPPPPPPLIVRDDGAGVLFLAALLTLALPLPLAYDVDGIPLLLNVFIIFFPIVPLPIDCCLFLSQSLSISLSPSLLLSVSFLLVHPPCSAACAWTRALRP